MSIADATPLLFNALKNLIAPLVAASKPPAITPSTPASFNSSAKGGTSYPLIFSTPVSAKEPTAVSPPVPLIPNREPRIPPIVSPEINPLVISG